jgi:ATP-dependent helicase/nuclease subunit B
MRKVLHIFPSTAVVDAFHRRFLDREGVLFGTAAITLKRLAGEIAALWPRAGRPLSNAGRRLVLEEIVKARYSGGEGAFAGHWNFPGFLGALSGFIGEAKQALIDADRFAEVARRIPDPERLAELASLYGLYEQALAERGIADENDMELAALYHLRSGGTLPTLFDDVARIRCGGIHDFTTLQLALLTEMSRRMPVEIVIPYDFGRTWLFSHISGTAAAIEALDDTGLNLEMKFVDPEGTFLVPLLETVFEGREKGQFPEGVNLPAVIAAPGVYRECEEIGRRIRAMMEDGTDPSAIAVLFRDTRSYSAMMEDVCRRYSIPVSYRRGMPLRTSSLVRTIMAPFDIISARFGREELFGLLNSSYFHPLQDQSGNSFSADSLEELLIAASYIDETVDPLQSRVGKWIAARKKRGLSCENEEGMLRALGALTKEIKGFANDMTIGEFVLRLEKFIERHSIYDRGIESLDNRALKRDASAIMGFQKVLRDLETDIKVLGMAGTVFTPAGFSSLLKHAMEEEFLAGERATGVTIMNFHDSRGLSFDHVFIGGLNEGVCPAGRIGHPLFKDSEKREFNRIAGKRCFITAAEKTGEEPLLFCQAVGCSEKSLTFTYSYADSGGNGVFCSPFLDEILEKLPLEEIRIPAGKVTVEPEECLEREELLNSLAAKGIFTLPPGDAMSLIGDSIRRIDANSLIEARREAFFLEEDMGRRTTLSTPYTGTIQREDILSELRTFYESPEGNTFAPTSLEEYGCCPFRYFLKRMVGLAPLEKPDMELEVKDEGSLVHEILQAFYQRLKTEGRLPLMGAAREREVLQEEADRAFARWESEKYTGESLLWEIEKKRLHLILQAVIASEAAEEGGFVPDAFEFAFPPLEVESAEGSKIRLKGKIDRMDVDRASGAVRIVDYKMASNRQKYADLLKKDRMGETSFQMPVYLLAASEAMKREFGISCQRMFARYWLLRKVIPLDKDLSGSGKEDFTGFFATGAEERRNLGEDNFLNRLCATVENIKNGDFQITPRECEFCDFAAVCRYVEVGLKEEE